MAAPAEEDGMADDFHPPLRHVAAATSPPTPRRRPACSDTRRSASTRSARIDSGWARPTSSPAALRRSPPRRGRDRDLRDLRRTGVRVPRPETQQEAPDPAAPGDYVFVPPFTPHREENNHPDQEAVVVIARSTQEAIVVNLPSLRPAD